MVRPARLLIIDDQEQNTRMLERILAKAGYEHVTSTNDSTEALGLQTRIKPDLILLDLHMRGKDGFAVLEEIVAKNGGADHVPVISMIPEIVTAGTDTALLGIGVSFESNAQLAAIYGIDILTGRAKVGDLKVGVVSPPDISVSFVKARQIGKRIPFHFFEGATSVYDVNGRAVRTPAREARTN